MSDRQAHLTPLDMDMLEEGGLDAPGITRIDEHLTVCDTCRDLLTRHRADRSRFVHELLPRTLDRLIARRASWWRSLFRLPVLLPATAGALAIMVVVVGALRSWRLQAPAEDGIAIKGSSVLQVFVRRTANALPTTRGVQAADGTTLRAGDALRFVVRPTGASYLLIAGVDGRGQIGIYFPFDGHASAPLEDVPRFEVPGSIVLEDSPGPERIFAFFSRKVIDADDVRAALSRVASGGHVAIRSVTRVQGIQAEQSSFLLENAGR